MYVRHTNENAKQADDQGQWGLRKESRLQVGVGGSSIARWYLKPRLDEVSNGKGEEAPRLLSRSQER